MFIAALFITNTGNNQKVNNRWQRNKLQCIHATECILIIERNEGGIHTRMNFKNILGERSLAQKGICCSTPKFQNRQNASPATNWNRRWEVDGGGLPGKEQRDLSEVMEMIHIYFHKPLQWFSAIVTILPTVYLRSVYFSVWKLHLNSVCLVGLL